MTWVIVGLMVVIVALLVLIIFKTRKVNELELSIVHYQTENTSLAVKCETLQQNINRLKATIEEIKAIETEKETKKKRSKKEAPPAGDSDARLDRLNSDSVQNG